VATLKGREGVSGEGEGKRVYPSLGMLTFLIKIAHDAKQIINPYKNEYIRATTKIRSIAIIS
jgi:hypothetical protein